MTPKNIFYSSIIFLTLFFNIVIQPAAADGNKLLKACTAGLKVINHVKELSGTEYMDAAFCAGLIQGVTDTNRIYRMSGIISLFCMPGDVIDKSKATRAVVTYLRAHPEKMKLHETDLVIDALKEAFPCK